MTFYVKLTRWAGGQRSVNEKQKSLIFTSLTNENKCSKNVQKIK